jgi:hypothetical protein
VPYVPGSQYAHEHDIPVGALHQRCAVYRTIPAVFFITAIHLSAEHHFIPGGYRVSADGGILHVHHYQAQNYYTRVSGLLHVQHLPADCVQSALHGPATLHV